MVGEYGISPSEYWLMSPNEVAIILEAKRPKVKGGLPEDDFDMLAMKRDQLIKEGVNVL